MSAPRGGDRIDVLRSVLDVALGIVRDLHDNPFFERLVNLFARMPEEDREPIVGALEREVQTRLLSLEVADTLTRIDLRPNPNARVYLRVVEPEDKSAEVEMVAFMRAAYSVQRGIDALDPQWRDMILMVLRQMDPAARAQIDGFNRAMRLLLDEAARLEGPAPEAPPAPADPEPVARSMPERKSR